MDLVRVKSSTAQDPTMNLLKKVEYNGWPPYKKQCPPELWECWKIRCDLVIQDAKNSAERQLDSRAKNHAEPNPTNHPLRPPWRMYFGLVSPIITL